MMHSSQSSRYFFRQRGSGSSPAAAPGYQPGYQPPAQHPAQHSPQPSSAPHLNLNTRIEDVNATLDGLMPMIDTMSPKTTFEISVCNVFRILIGQMKEIKLGQVKLQESTVSSLGVVDEQLTDISRTAAKGEQYHRRDTLTVTGVPMASGETDVQLENKVATSLSLSGETVTPTDFSVIHRNGKQIKTTHQGKEIPPSVTVRFSKIGKKDKVLRGYKNFDSTTKAPRPVKVFQSLSPHYSGLRRYIVDFFKDTNRESNIGKQLSWCTYQSPSAGLAVKLKSGEFMRDIHVADDFLCKFAEFHK